MKICANCKYGVRIGRDYFLRCSNILVNAKNIYYLSSGKVDDAILCHYERDDTWFAPCGRSGKLFEQKEV